MDRRTLGERIRSARELRGMSQQDVARLFGCARETVSNWERGERGIEAPELARLAPVLEVDITYFYGAGEYQADDVPPELQMVYGLQGRVVSRLPPGRARQRYIEGLRAQAESNWELIANRVEEEELKEGQKEEPREKPKEEQEEIGRSGRNAGMTSKESANHAAPDSFQEKNFQETGRKAKRSAGKPQHKQEP